ncbi:MAG: aldehyde dehydrogenase family protein [Porticoccaceae bacterium]|nr:aldehyde dehydrogenase family protein [Porticoccaceae bacterium]
MSKAGDKQSKTPPQVRLMIGDCPLDEGSGGFHTHINPATGKPQAEIPLAGVTEIDQAVEAAERAFEIWRRVPGAERRDLLLRLAGLIRENAAEFGRLAALDCGIPVMVGGTFAPQIAAEWITYYAGWADKIEGQVVLSYPSDDFAYTLSEPYGVIGMITTWNGPLVSLGMKVPAALAAGNTVVIKPSEISPFVTQFFAELVERAGFPAGVVNMVPGGPAAGQRLVEHPAVQKVSFTGGPVTARKIMHSCAEALKPMVMELGGKACNLIFADADLDNAAEQAVYESLGVLSGQACAIPSRVAIEHSVYDEVVEKMASIASKLPVGDPFDPATLVGPLISEAAVKRVKGLVDEAASSGRMRLVMGGERCGGDLAGGYYMAPTLFADVDPQDPLAQGEIFGPVLTIHRFNNEEEAIAIANATPYGLGGYLHTSNIKRGHRVAAALKTGNVYINRARTLAAQVPFGGVGISGFGREGGRPGLEEFLRHKNIGLSQ